MKLRSIALATLAVTSFGAQAALATYAPWDAALAGNGLSGVLFDVQTNGNVTSALGAHAYKNGVSLPNDGVGTFYAQAGTYPGEPDRANWSFDWAFNLGTCSTCTVWLGVDIDPTSGVNLVFGNITAVPQPQSWNLMMGFLQAGYAFDPFSASSTAFSLEIREGASRTAPLLVSSAITVNVPEPGSLALAGLALAGLSTLRRRKA